MEQKIVLVGVGGTGMSGIAGMFLDLGYTNIVGIDSDHSQLTDSLEQQWLSLIYGHGKYQVTPGETVIYSVAAEQSPEVQQALSFVPDYAQWMLVLNYFQFLGEISKYFRTLAIAWTNGKSTTTALALYAAKEKIPDFGIGILGALMPDLGNKSYYLNEWILPELRNIFNHILTGKWLDYSLIKKYIFIVEACEYRRHFLHLDADYSCITSLELDHTDYYKDMADYTNAFIQFIGKTKKRFFCSPTFPKDRIPEDQLHKCVCLINSLPMLTLHHVFGEHYRINTALVTPALEAISGVKIAHDTRQAFHGLRRRMEYLGKTQHGAAIYTDYAHMPSSLAMIYQSFHHQFPDKKICAVFQPHQVHRILQSWDEFVASLIPYDEKIIYSIYAAREDTNKVYEHNGKAVGTVSDIGVAIAQESWSTYETDFTALWEKLNWYNDERIVVILTAGDLDYMVRNVLVNTKK